jgi:UDP-N-acetylmuramyl tripeptide synthase
VVDFHAARRARALLASLRELTTGRLIVLKLVGDRDKGKRSLMGDFAGRLADVATTTTTEDEVSMATITFSILAGVGQHARRSGKRGGWVWWCPKPRGDPCGHSGRRCR